MTYLFHGLAGAFFGALAGCGVGGGTLLLLYLTALAGVQPGDAKLINLLFFLCCALSALVSHLKNRLVDRPTALPCILAGLPACILGALAANRLPQGALSKIFAVLFVISGVKELFSALKDK